MGKVIILKSRKRSQIKIISSSNHSELKEELQQIITVASNESHVLKNNNERPHRHANYFKKYKILKKNYGSTDTESDIPI